MDSEVRAQKIYRVTLAGMVVNILLCTFKFVAGFVGRSGAMVADAVHSASDLATDLVVLLFVRISSKPKDRNHKWGHGKYETFATLIIGVALGVVGVQILLTSAQSIAAVVRGEVLPRPGGLALIAAAVSILVKEVLYRYTVAVGKQVDSPSVIANSWHHRSDALSSIGTLVGIGAAYFLGPKWRIADPIAAIVVAALILKVAIDLSRTAINEMLERSLPESVEAEILSEISSVEGVCDPHNLRTRRLGPSIAVEVHIRVDGCMSVTHSHDITREIERRLKARYGRDTSVAIHVEPLK
ncbi:MAG: cation transporter [Alistipes sp.]|nr:cation transporter [Alistipes sp.]